MGPITIAMDKVDEGIELQTDTLNWPNNRVTGLGQTDCGRRCVITACNPGFTDANGLQIDGCEQGCRRAWPEVMAVMMIDGRIDEEVVAQEGDVCKSEGVCQGSWPFAKVH